MQPGKHVLLTGTPGVGKTTCIESILTLLRRKWTKAAATASGNPMPSVSGFVTREVRDSRGSRMGFDVVPVKTPLQNDQDGENSSRFCTGSGVPLARLAIVTGKDVHGAGGDRRAGSRAQAGLAVGSSGRSRPTVGRYEVEVDGFEAFALPLLEEAVCTTGGRIMKGYGKQSSNASSSTHQAGEPSSLSSPTSLLVIDEIGKMELLSRGFERLMGEILKSGCEDQKGQSARHSTIVLGTIALKGGGFVARVKEFPGVEVVEVTRSNRDEVPQMVVDTFFA